MLKVIEAFAGVGSQRMALRNLGIEHKIVGIFEIDKFALKSYEAIHGECPNLGDISKIKVEDIPQHDLFTYSFPCQDLSVAGKQKGMIRGVTRSGLLYECERIIKYCKPKYLLLENVKNLVGKKNKPQFDEWLKFLEDLGYTNYWKVLNAKDYGVPQNRERVFVVSILGEHESYNFPSPVKLDKSIKDILEDEVEEKYYFKTDKAEKLILKVKDSMSNKKECCDSTLLKPKILQVGNCITARYDAGIQNKQSIGVAVVEKILISQATKKGYIEMEVPGVCDLSYPNSKTRRGRVQEKGKISPTLTASENGISYINKEYRVRKLTPLECWRLMAFTDEDFY